MPKNLIIRFLLIFFAPMAGLVSGILTALDLIRAAFSPNKTLQTWMDDYDYDPRR